MLDQKNQKAVELEHKDIASGVSTKSYVPKTEQTNLYWNSIWTMVPGYDSNAKCFALPHFMAPININVVHRTAALEGYGGLVYRERMALHCLRGHCRCTGSFLCCGFLPAC